MSTKLSQLYILVNSCSWCNGGCINWPLHHRQIWSKVQHDNVFLAVYGWLDHDCRSKGDITVLYRKIHDRCWPRSNILYSASKYRKLEVKIVVSIYHMLQRSEALSRFACDFFHCHHASS